MRLVSLALCLLLLATACAPASSGLKEVSLVLDWYPNAVHAFVYAAEDEGFFKAEGLKVNIKMPAENPTDGLKLVAAGKETFAFYYQPDVLIARANANIPVVSVAAVVRHPLNHPMAPKVKGIASPKDFEGKTVGYATTEFNVALITTMVRAAGGDPAKVKLHDVGFDLIPAIATQKVDGLVGAYVNHEEPVFEKRGIPMVSFDPVKFGVPDYYEMVLIAGEETVKKDRKTVEAFWRALAKGHEKVKQDPAAALKRLLERQSKEFPLEADVEEKSLAFLLPRMDDGGKVKFGLQEKANWDRLAAWMVENKLLRAAPKVEEAFVNVVGN